MSKEPISVLLSPWSPPACWKTPPERPKNDASVYGDLPGHMKKEIDYDTPSRCNGGSLKPEYGRPGPNIRQYLSTLISRRAYPSLMSIQNESLEPPIGIWPERRSKDFPACLLIRLFEAADSPGKWGIYIWGSQQGKGSGICYRHHRQRH